MAGESMAAGINGLGFYPNFFNSYANNVMLNDLCDTSYYPQTMGMMNPMMSMNGSIFGGGMGAYPMMPTFGMGMGYSQDEYFEYMDKYQDHAIDYQVRQQQKMRQADVRLNTPREASTIAANHLREKILDNEQEQIKKAFEDYVASVEALCGGANSGISREQIVSRAEMLYQQQFGVGITEDIRKHGTGSFKQGFLQTLTLGLADKKTAEQNIADITGQPVGRDEKTKKIFGNMAGGVALGAGTAVSANAILKGLKLGFKNKPFVAGLIGAGIGALAAIFTANKD